MHPLPDFAIDWIEKQLQNSRGLKQASRELSRSYRSKQPGRHLGGAGSIEAYLAARMPATFAAVSHVLNTLTQVAPDFDPKHLLDLGAGPGTATLAATALWPRLSRMTLLEREPEMIRAGKALFAAGPESLAKAQWQQGHLPALPAADADLILLAYVLNEIGPRQRADVHQALLEQKGPEHRVIVAIEPGTPEGYAHILELRTAAVRNNWQIWAPCPHQGVCPIQAPDWCHFSVRLQRSRLHRLLKDGSQSFEDEKFAYLMLSRLPAPNPACARILRHPLKHRGHLELELCTPEGQQKKVLGKSEPDYKAARKAEWGDDWKPTSPES